MPSNNTSFYQYDPSSAAAIIFAVLYAIVTLTTVFQFFRYRAWAWLSMVVASISMVAYLEIDIYH
jgi:membrane protein YdbS with pleckstrin-like domain